jgi:hypothetical protein
MASLFAQHLIAWSGVSQGIANNVFDRSVGISHWGSVGLGGHLEILGSESVHRHLVGLLGNGESEGEVVCYGKGQSHT